MYGDKLKTLQYEWYRKTIVQYLHILQVQGMGTALKILFSGDRIGLESTVNAHHKQRFQLRRSEIVSLFNAFGRYVIDKNLPYTYLITVNSFPDELNDTA